MKESWQFAVLPDVQLGRELFAINSYDPWWLFLRRIPQKEKAVGEAIAERLKRAVEWINLQPIEFVVSIGNLTDSGSPEQLRRTSEICSEFKKPFIPLLGNHDLWPYRREQGKMKVIWEAERAWSVDEFESYFPDWKNSPCFENFKAQGKGLQNYTFTVKEIRFVVVDNNNRRKAPFGLPEQAGWAKLYSESKEWLTDEVLSSQERIVILSHAPLAKSLLKDLQKRTDKKFLTNISGHTHKRTEWRYRKKKGEIVRITTNAIYHEPLILLAHVSLRGIGFEYQRI